MHKRVSLYCSSIIDMYMLKPSLTDSDSQERGESRGKLLPLARGDICRKQSFSCPSHVLRLASLDIRLWSKHMSTEVSRWKAFQNMAIIAHVRSCIYPTSFWETPKLAHIQCFFFFLYIKASWSDRNTAHTDQVSKWVMDWWSCVLTFRFKSISCCWCDAEWRGKMQVKMQVTSTNQFPVETLHCYVMELNWLLHILVFFLKKF